MLAVGYDGDSVAAVAMQISQVFLSGEIWGLNRSLIEPEPRRDNRVFQIPWPEMKLAFEQTLAHYILLAQHALQNPLPIVLVAGLDLVDQAFLVPQKTRWFSNPPKPARCFAQKISHVASVKSWDDPPETLLDPFFAKVFDASGLDYEEWRAFK
jgi:hypothetical protein